MSDMRATEQLLTFIGANTDDASIQRAATELRSRGDTLVRRDDLRTVLEAVGRDAVKSDKWIDDAALNTAWDRLLTALGGT
jgi:hypothetical protein